MAIDPDVVDTTTPMKPPSAADPPCEDPFSRRRHSAGAGDPPTSSSSSPRGGIRSSTHRTHSLENFADCASNTTVPVDPRSNNNIASNTIHNGSNCINGNNGSHLPPSVLRNGIGSSGGRALASSEKLQWAENVSRSRRSLLASITSHPKVAKNNDPINHPSNPANYPSDHPNSKDNNSISSSDSSQSNHSNHTPNHDHHDLHHGKVSGINGGFAPSGNKHIELRNKRLSATRRASSSSSQCSPSSRGSSYKPLADKVNYFADQVMGSLGPDMLRVPKRYRSVVALMAFVGCAGMLYVTFQPDIIKENLMSASDGIASARKLKEFSSGHRVGSGNGDMERMEISHPNPNGNSDFLDDFDQRRRRAADLPDGTVFTEPAHTRMCRTILDRLDAYDAGTTTFEQVVFTESEYVCRDPDAPYTSVMNMFAAQLLDVANNAIGLNVDYTHRCAKWERYCSGNMTTVQFGLPDPLTTNAYAFQPGCVDAPTLRTICNDCLSSGSTNPDCVLFPNGYFNTNTKTCDLGCYFSQVLPWIRNNLRIVATEWLNTVETRALTFWLRNAAEFSHREKDDMEVSVVSLSCSNEDCDMTMDTCVCEFSPLPNWVYALHIPRSSTNVAIIVSPTCAKFGEGCTLHAQELYHFFHSLYPRADITYNVITSTSSWYMRMITADHLICPPGVGCLIPAIARDAYTYVYETTFVVSASTWLTCVPNDYLARLTIPSFPPIFVQGDCRHVRARIGAWTQDMDLATSLQYTTPVDGYLGCADTNFVATAEDPYRSPTTYRWDESIWTTCPVEVMTKEALCTQMDRLRLSRILFVGDHTTMSQAISLASILGQNGNISLDPNVVPNFTKTITCTGTTTITSFQLTFTRNDRLEEPGTTPSPGNPNCGVSNEQYCYPWSSNYAGYAGKQLLIVNTGYHWADDWEGYITNFQNFVGRIDEIAGANAARANDVLMFRTSVPGHKECDLHDGVFLNYGEYCPRIVNGAWWKWWGELPPYNDYAIRIINEWNLLNTVKSGANIELLDPWMMTILRPDGHLSGSDAGSNCPMDPQECMLYSLPGPVDWWNHLLVMQLADIATHVENESPMVAWR